MDLAFYLLTFSAGFTLAFFLQRRKYKKLLLKVVEALAIKHEQQFAEMIDKMNHEGPIPHSASAIGLLSLTLSAVLNCISLLEGLLKSQDWNTTKIITELREIVANEMALLLRKLRDFLESRRQILREYNKHQGIE
jgi:hypothetical protein